MTTGFTIADLVRDIEIELLQGDVLDRELSASVAEIRRFQQQMRTQLLDGSGRIDLRTVAGRQFEMNDLLLTLLHETALRLETLQREQHAVIRRLADAVPPSAALNPPAANAQVRAEVLPAPGDAALPVDAWTRRLAEVAAAMRGDALQLDVALQGSGTPVVGSAVDGLKRALHGLVIFYTNRLAERQSAINRLYGQWIIHLHEQARAQDDELGHLRAAVRALQARLDRLEQQAP
jgi:hypothetical protein